MKSNQTHSAFSLQAHFHWGSDPSKGSEHTINGKPHSLEMHLVHQNIANDSNLLVVGILFDEKISKHGPKKVCIAKSTVLHFSEVLFSIYKLEIVEIEAHEEAWEGV